MVKRQAKMGRCKHCNGAAFHKCHRCGAWLCAHGGAPCGRLRKVPKEVGRYDLICWPRCRKTRSDFGTTKVEPSREELEEEALTPCAKCAGEHYTRNCPQARGYDCSCGRRHTWPEFLALEQPPNGGHMESADDNGAPLVLHFRNCACGSTMTRPAPPDMERAS